MSPAAQSLRSAVHSSETTKQPSVAARSPTALAGLRLG